MKIKITKDGVVKTTMHGDKPIPILDSTQIEILEGEFHKPYCRLSSFFRGNKLSLDFKNNCKFEKRFIVVPFYSFICYQKVKICTF